MVDLGVEKADLPGGGIIDLEVVRHPGGSCVVPVDEHRRVCMLNQYRHAVGGWLRELPAGKIDDGEPPLDTAMRELAEEAGLVAAKWTNLGGIVTAPGFTDEVIHLYLAEKLTVVPPSPSAHERLEPYWVDLDEAAAAAMSGELRDAKTIIALLRARKILGKATGI